SQAKAGADILAIHPTLRDPQSGQPYILAATQVFGRGRCTVLTTDSLWKWKMREPSQSSQVATFWQQLLSAYSRRSDPPALHFIRPPATVVQGTRQQLTLTSSAPEPAPRVIARNPENREIVLTTSADSANPASWTVEWPADQAGMWQIIASQQGSIRAFIFPDVTPRVTGELADVPPDREHLSHLATQTGGALLDHTIPLQWIHETKPDHPSQQVTQTRTEFLWNTPFFLSLAVSCYLLELTLRRRWRLL
ncbi:MAG TPA: hypothetical protein PLN52_01230, partial [Opitutaceae bacterium]|nr:hypothetical protein [Opitutaceae bacterium]